jgi:dTDP-4-dehydrorhamnose reductase
MPKRILVTGKNGQLGQSIQQIAAVYPHYVFEFVGREALDLSAPKSIADYFANKSFDIIISCAAYTAVEQAETEADLVDKINHLAVKQLAKIAKQKDISLIHISTDYVFNGQNFKPYTENDPTDPQSVYGSTKLKGEQAIQKINPKGCIIRTSWLYSEYGNNFVKTMLKLGKEKDSLNVIFDQVGTPTYAGDLAKAILDIISQESMLINNQIYHFSNEGVCSWYDFAKAIFTFSYTECDVRPIEAIDYPVLATRPHYSLLNKTKIKRNFNLTIAYWKDSLKHCLQILQEQKN